MIAPGRWSATRALVGAGLALLAAASYAPMFGRGAADVLADRRFTLPVVGAAALVAATCLLLAYGTRFAPVSRVAVALGALAGYVVLVLAPGRAVADGPRRLVTTALPIEPAGPELAAVVIAIGLATLGAVEPALRRRAALLPLAAPLVATGLGCALSVAAGPPPGWLVPGYALGAAALLLIDRRRSAATVEMAPGRLRQVLAAGMGVAVLAGTAGVGWYGPELLTGRSEPVDPRQLVPQPVDPRQPTSPLVLLPALRDRTQNLQLTVHSDRPLDRLRYVTLDRFDGQHWTAEARYQRAGQQLPLGPPVLGEEEREERVEVADAGPLGWLVSSGRPIEVSVPGLGVNEQTGDVVLPADRAVPTSYTVRSVVAEPDPDLLEVATPETATTDPVLLSSEVGKELRITATDVVGGAGYGYPALAAIEEWLRGFDVNPARDAPGGHGLAQIRALLEDEVGTAEQYASAFAVLARVLGYQSRVVVGFQPEPRDGEPGVYRVTGRMVHAWAEVRFADALGWVPFDPTPPTESESESRSDDDSEEPSGSSETDQDRPDRAEEDPLEAAGDRDTDGSPLRAVAAYAGRGAAAVAALLLLAALAVPLAKVANRWRRRAARDPGIRAVRAWRDCLDRLVEVGVRVNAADTTGEVVATTGQRFETAVTGPVGRLAALHNLAAFGPDRPTGAVAETAWRHADQVRHAIREAVGPARRLRAALSLRPLLRRGGQPGR